MAKEGGYRISEIYQGGYSSLEPSYGDTFVGYHLGAGKVGAPTKPDTANQIQQVNMLLNQGIVPIEVGALSPEVFDQIPKTHFKEIRRMINLSGGKVSVHAPIVEPSGITEYGWSEANRQVAEKKLIEVVEKAYELDNKGKIPITIHSSGLPGTEYAPSPEGKKEKRVIIINRETGKLAPIEEEKRHYPHLEDIEKGKTYSPKEEIEILNKTEWDNSLSQIIFYKENADRLLNQYWPIAKDLLPLFEKGEFHSEHGKFKPEHLSPQDWEAFSHIQNAEAYLQNAQEHLSSLFSKAWKYGTPEQKKELKRAAERFKQRLEASGGKDLKEYSNALQELVTSLKQDKLAPRIYVPIEEFAIEHSAKTFANVALHAYSKFGEKAPKICIENVPAGMAFSFGEDLKKLILESKKKFVEAAVAKGYSEEKAKKAADEIIGATLDVGHLNIAKKYGFKDKDILKEVEKIAKHVLHVHLTDNFGYSDSHLPPGMGNVPFKEILEKLEKEGRLEEMRAIVEAGGFVQHFGVSPYPASLEALGSPIYAMDMQPYWNQMQGFYQGYFTGYEGRWLPQINYETFGAGFTQLPRELGGQTNVTPGGRMSGRPME